MIYQLWQLLTESAKRHPNAIAVSASVSGGTASLTYAELDEQSSRLATLLVAAGVVRGSRVAFALPKSLESVVAIFGIMKAGGVYVPIDAASPKGRFAYIVRNCGIRHLITRSQLASTLAEGLGATAGDELDLVLLTDQAEKGGAVEKFGQAVRSWSEVAQHAPRAPSEEGCETDLAYVLYTSGSTGAPKGVMITHLASLTFVNWTHDRFGVTHDDVVSSHAPLHFDLSIFDIFTAIKAGARIVLVPERLSTFPIRLAEFIRDQRISIWYSVPSALTLMLERGNFADHEFRDLRIILFAGEVFPIKFLQALMRATKAELFNLYGPTETNVCTYYEVRPSDLERATPVPIGIPIANYDVFAVGDDGQMISRVGEKGELWGRGPGLMSGYWGDSEKTNRTLRPNPFAPHLPNDRIFATGDIVSLDETGNFIYHGRRDNMIKSRGYRIELGEIEAALYRHPHVREAAVIPVPDPLLTNRLRAVLVLQEEGAASVDDLREFCRNELPRYMVPDALELRGQLPKTSTGKIDRQALAAEDTGGAS